MTYRIKKHILRDFEFYFYAIVIYQVKTKDSSLLLKLRKSNDNDEIQEITKRFMSSEFENVPNLFQFPY